MHIILSPQNDHLEMRQYPSMLDALEKETIFAIEKKGDLFEFTEQCDLYFSCMLSRDQLRILAQELIDISYT